MPGLTSGMLPFALFFLTAVILKALCTEHAQYAEEHSRCGFDWIRRASAKQRDEELIACKACHSACKRDDIKIKRGRYFKIEGEKRHRSCAFMCV
jgi:hypothetical protein